MRAAPFVCLFVACALAACNGSHGDTPLISDSRSPITDVPVPAGFTMTKDSTSKQVAADQTRWVDHRYHGNDGVLPVANFYQAELPKHQWTLIDTTQPNGREVTLHFQKNKEDCTVTVTRRTFDTEIHIQIAPIGTAASS